MIAPAVSTLPPVTLPVTLELDPVITPPTTLAAVAIPDTLTLAPVIAPAVSTLPPVTLPVAEIMPPVSTLPPATLPVTLNDPSVPTVVKLEIKTPELNVLPVNVPAGATTALVLAAVNCPC